MKVQWLHLTPTKMGLALHCHGELKLTKWKWKREEIQRGKKGSSHQPQQTTKRSKTCCSSSKMSKMSFPSRKQKKKGHLTHQRKLAPGGSLSPLGASHQTGAKVFIYHPAASRYRQAVSGNGAWLAFVWRLALAASCAWRQLCVVGRFLLTFFLFSLLFRVTHLSGLLEQSFQSTKRTQKWGLVVYLDQCNLKCIYLQK